MIKRRFYFLALVQILKQINKKLSKHKEIFRNVNIISHFSIRRKIKNM